MLTCGNVAPVVCDVARLFDVSPVGALVLMVSAAVLVALAVSHSLRGY